MSSSRGHLRAIGIDPRDRKTEPDLLGATGGARTLRREIVVTIVGLAITGIAAMLLGRDVGTILVRRLATGSVWTLAELGAFTAIVYFLIYGNLVYHIARLGALLRQTEHVPRPREALERIHGLEAPPSLTILVPSFREEAQVVFNTLLSAALLEYPEKRIVLLLDDPPNPGTPQARHDLQVARELPARIAALLDPEARFYEGALAAYVARSQRAPLDREAECERLAELYERAALWLERLAANAPRMDHTERFVADRILREPARAHRERALALRRGFEEPRHLVAEERIDLEYRRLAALFRTSVTSFERKRFANLSHEANKAMNLNAYIGLMGLRFREAGRTDGLHLVPTEETEADLAVPDADFLITLDADSALLHDYALRLVDVMQQPGNGRIAVAQTPYSAFPGPADLLERMAGSTTDIQHIIHQGFTRFSGTYWVGANAMIRRAGLVDIAEPGEERGYPVTRFIQDRTVIEDTESSIDLIAHGWDLYNYPDRLAYSATPPDFGALVIQRQRWANGGLIILPKLFRCGLGSSKGWKRLMEGFVRLHYLTSPAGVSIGVLALILFPFEESMRSIWLPISALPYFTLYSRDQSQSGYRWSDVVRVYALNLLLMPVNLGGVARSLHQAVTGRKTPFGRTPKVPSRTATGPLYLLAPALIGLYCVFGFGVDLTYGRWAHAGYLAMTGALMAYALTYFVGLRNMREDLQAAWPRRPAVFVTPPTAQPLESPAVSRGSWTRPDIRRLSNRANANEDVPV